MRHVAVVQIVCICSVVAMYSTCNLLLSLLLLLLSLSSVVLFLSLCVVPFSSYISKRTIMVAV
jgi:hypothetical protein